MIGEIVTLLDGLPLAVELAASLVGVLGLADIRRRLDDRFALLTKGRRTALPRQQTLAATLDWSYRLLSADEQALLRRLSVFAGSFDADAVQAVADWDQNHPGPLTEAIWGLCAKSLLTTVSSGRPERRYRLLETTRQYAHQRLAQTGEQPEAEAGLEHTDDRIRDAIDGGANVVMAGRAVTAKSAARFGGGASLALMLTASAAEAAGGPVVTRIGSVSEALRLAADAVVVYVALGGEGEASMISYLSDIGEECDRSGMPLIAEAEFPDAYSGSSSHDASWATRYLTRETHASAPNWAPTSLRSTGVALQNRSRKSWRAAENLSWWPVARSSRIENC